MPSTGIGLVNHIRSFVELQAAGQVADHELLERFVLTGDEDAFSALMRRHGPMVAGVCRRMLKEADAEDAYQATFFVLARKAASIHKRDSIGSWLHGVALRVAGKARSRAARRAMGERGRPAPMVAKTGDDITWGELRTVLDEELGNLALSCRTPLILCYLEGRTQDEAARQLGWSKSTLRRRLERGRNLLQSRLTRRGLTLSAGLFTLIPAQAAVAALPKSGTAVVVKTALLFATNRSVAKELAAGSVTLAESVLRGMILAKNTLWAAVVLTTSLLVGLGLYAYQSSVKKPPTLQDPVADRKETKPAPADPVDQFGDPLPAEALARLGTIRFQHGALAFAIAFAPDGRSLASGGIDGNVHIWERTTGKELLRIADTQFPDPLGLGGINALAYAPDGKTLAVARINEQVCLCDVATGKFLRHFGGKNHRADWVEFSTDGKVLAFGSARQDQTVHLADVNTGKELHRFKDYNGSMTRFAFSADGKTFASADDGGILLFELIAGKVRQLPRPDGQGVRFDRLVISADGKILAASNHAKKLIRLVEIPSGKTLRSITLTGKREEVGPILFTPDSKTLISAHHDGFVRFWEASSGLKTRQFRAYPDRIAALALSPDSSTLATSRWAHVYGEQGIVLWETATGKPLVRHPGPRQGVYFLAFSPDSRRMATASGEGAIYLWDAAKGKLLRDWKGFGPMAFTADGKMLVCGGWSDGKVRFLDLATGKETRAFQVPGGGIRCLNLSRDGRRLATAGFDGFRICDLDGKTIQDFGGKQLKAVFSIALSADGKLLASIHEDHAIRLWDKATGKLIREQREPNHVGSVAFSPDGKILASTFSGGPAQGVQSSIRLRDVATGKVIHQLTGVGDPTDSIAFSPDGRTLIWAGQRSKDLYLWEVATGQLRHKFTGHQGQIGRLAFSADGRLMASGSSDASALIWDVTGQRSRQKPATILKPATLNQLWTNLAEPDAALAFQAICALRSSPVETVPFLAHHLKPVPAADAKRVAEAIRNLGSAQFALRDKAKKELEDLGEAAEPALLQALGEKGSLEARRRLEQLLRRLEGPHVLRRSRALEVLEHIGDSASRRLLFVLAQGAPRAILTQDAQAALDRLKIR